jgi:hypothetical protein
MPNLSRILALVAIGSAVFLSVDVLRLQEAFRGYMPGPPHANPGMTSFIGIDPDGIWVGTAEAEGHGAVRRTPYTAIGSVADSRNRVVIFDRNGAVLADVDARSQDPVMVNYIRKRVQESR